MNVIRDGERSLCSVKVTSGPTPVTLGASTRRRE